ncbi:hypothetical protein RRF57_008458 [Xylaria bambusicola]|uniref:Uncharacterized protein n=1 Tax=Xylaria bambusicola TaxID=326684 RepID=A0AAN7UY17_9PEZI
MRPGVTKDAVNQGQLRRTGMIRTMLRRRRQDMGSSNRTVKREEEEEGEGEEEEEEQHSRIGSQSIATNGRESQKHMKTAGQIHAMLSDLAGRESQLGEVVLGPVLGMPDRPDRAAEDEKVPP